MRRSMHVGLPGIMWVAAAMLAVPAAAQVPADVLTAPPRSLVTSAGLDVTSTNVYVWRGFVPTDASSVQSTLWFKVGDITLTSWANLASAGPVTEHDFSVDYTYTDGAFTVSAGWINYLFPTVDAPRHSDELYGSVTHTSFLNPTIRMFVDGHAGHGWYGAASVAHDFAAPHGLVISPSVSIGYNGHQWIPRSTWSDASVSVKARVPLGSAHLALVPSITYSRSLASDLFPSRWYGGLGFSVR